MQCDLGGDLKILLYFNAAIVLALHLEIYFCLPHTHDWKVIHLLSWELWHTMWMSVNDLDFLFEDIWVQTFVGRWSNLSPELDNNSRRLKALNVGPIYSASMSPYQSYYIYGFETLFSLLHWHWHCCIFVHSMMTMLCIWICIINHIKVFDWFNKCIW